MIYKIKNSITVFLLTLFFSCDNQNAMDCFQAAGSIIQEEIVVEPFSTILVEEEVILILRQGDEQQVVIETGKNLLNDVKVYVENNQLVLQNENQCNYVRDYELTKVYVTSPNITQIRCATNRYIQSEGTLTYPNLTLLSENWNSNYLASGDVELTLDATQVSVVANGTSIFKISGKAERLNINFAANDCRFEGENFIVNQVQFNHKSSNDIIINPQTSLKGTIYSVGNVVAKNRPITIEVDERYKGKLIIEE